MNSTPTTTPADGHPRAFVRPAALRGSTRISEKAAIKIIAAATASVPGTGPKATSYGRSYPRFDATISYPSFPAVTAAAKDGDSTNGHALQFGDTGAGGVAGTPAAKPGRISAEAVIVGTYPSPIYDVAVRAQRTIAEWLVAATGMHVDNVQVTVGPVVPIHQVTAADPVGQAAQHRGNSHSTNQRLLGSNGEAPDPRSVFAPVAIPQPRPLRAITIAGVPFNPADYGVNNGAVDNGSVSNAAAADAENSQHAFEAPAAQGEQGEKKQ